MTKKRDALCRPAQGVPRLPAHTWCRQIPAGTSSGLISRMACPRVSDTRNCDHAGYWIPWPEHGRFCTARCLAERNSKRMGDLAGGATTLTWSVTAMSREVRGRSWV